MASNMILQAVVAACIAIDFTLVGNAITQSFMTLPALIVDFPSPSSPSFSSRATLLGKQWPICWVVGNNFMRPISTLSTLGYAFAAFQLSRTSTFTTDPSEDRNWKFFAFAALLHVSVIVNSAVNMQPLNAKLTSLAGVTADGKGRVETGDQSHAVETATKWIRGNLYRVFVPAVSGGIALYQTLF